MPSSLSTRVAWIPMGTFNSATLNGTYQAIGNPLPKSCFLVKIVNESNVGVSVSTDGTTDQDRAPAGAFFLYDESANANREGGAYIPAFTQFYIKGAAGIGNIYLIGQYRTGG